MAALQSIRNHGVAVVTIVGLAMLAFILGDLLNSGNSLIHRNQDVVGVIAGKKITYRDFEAQKERLTEAYKIENNRSTLTEEEQTWIRQQTWNSILMQNTMENEAKKIGMTITEDELAELCLGSHPHPLIAGRRVFQDENGQFSPKILQNFYNQVFLQGEESEENPNLEAARNYWLYWENAVRISYLQEKLTALLQLSVAPTTAEVKFAQQAMGTSANVEYVCQPYYQISDSLVSVSEEDIKKLYDERKPLYKQTPNRAIAYLSFDVTPSEEDYQKIQEIMVKAENDLRTAEDIAMVTNMTSDIVYNEQDYSKATIPAEYKDFAFGAGAKKDAFLPLQYNPETHTFSTARIVECGYSLPDSVELKAIAPEGQEGAKDQELGWIASDQLFSNKDLYEKALHAQKGQHITIENGDQKQEFEVMDLTKPTPRAKVAIISREVNPSNRTYSNVFNHATQFLVANQDEQAIREAAQKEGLMLRPQYGISEMTEQIGNLRDSRKIVRWVYEAKAGDVSQVFDCGDSYVIAIVTEVNDGDYRSLDGVRGELTQLARNNAKYEYVKKELEGATTMEAVAGKLGQSVQTAEGVSLSSPLFGQQGNEPAVVGTAMAAELQKVSAPVKGQTGVYVVRTLAKNAAEGEQDAAAVKQALAQRNQYLPYQAMQVMEDEADVKDNRAKFY